MNLSLESGLTSRPAEGTLQITPPALTATLMAAPPAATNRQRRSVNLDGHLDSHPMTRLTEGCAYLSEG
ncbi:hypothetical protein [Streptomyces sp. NRRL B-24484]|uniref:hypothetical protein n=1 Tax=Streptomyces sp. NRRL B-24484 TaxID=1463833 RepID=UPI0013318EE9|nr:hypothetical protein [Streptomyces sp. NRRL B-24484]